MRFLIQRVREANVRVEGEIAGAIGRGAVVFIGISDTDDKKVADRMIEKLTRLRFFPDEAGRTNRSIADVGGSFLLISQFTLYADCRSGNRPSFVSAGAPDAAEKLYSYIIDQIRSRGFFVQTGVFGAHMDVSLCNDGPFTIWLDSEELFGSRAKELPGQKKENRS